MSGNHQPLNAVRLIQSENRAPPAADRVRQHVHRVEFESVKETAEEGSRVGCQVDTTLVDERVGEAVPRAVDRKHTMPLRQ